VLALYHHFISALSITSKSKAEYHDKICKKSLQCFFDTQKLSRLVDEQVLSSSFKRFPPSNHHHLPHRTGYQHQHRRHAAQLLVNHDVPATQSFGRIYDIKMHLPRFETISALSKSTFRKLTNPNAANSLKSTTVVSARHLSATPIRCLRASANMRSSVRNTISCSTSW
jgi:hypothetical protein